MSSIKPITMPKWGLAMEEGVLARWAVEEGAEIALGQEIMDIETTKIANVFESPVAGVLRKKVVGEGETVPVGALLGVVAGAGRRRRRGGNLRRRVPRRASSRRRKARPAARRRRSSRRAAGTSAT